MSKLMLFLMLPLSLMSWEFMPSGSTPKKGEIILKVSSKTDKVKKETNLIYMLTRYDPDQDQIEYIYRGYWKLTDEELLELFKGNIHFEFNP